MRTLIALIVGTLLGLGAMGYAWVSHPLTLPAPSVDLAVEPGSTARDVVRAVSDSGVQVHPTALYWWFRLSGQARQIRAGSYELDRSTTPWTLLRKLVRGEESMRSITLLEGWTFKQMREALLNAEQLKPVSQEVSVPELMAQLGRPGLNPEGRFFPDTYTYAKGSSDLAVLQRALRAMDKRLEAAWAQRDSGLPLKSAEEALILASIIEKETGRSGDQAMIAAVFCNRLKLGMRLQTDPTVIYGMGDSFDGNLRKNDLLRDTPWNTYTRAGLPPTSISMPGKAALLAAVQPAASKALYFVARGDGTSQFSATLDEHNRAVNKYQRGL